MSAGSPPPGQPRSPNAPHSRNPIVDHGLRLQLLAGQSRYALKWGAINVALLALILYDLSCKCPFATSLWYWAEYAFAALLALSGCYNFGRYFYGRLSMQPVSGTAEQRRLLRFEETDKSFVCAASQAQQEEEMGRMGGAKVGAPLNVSQLSWHSSFNESTRSIVPPSWLYGTIGGSVGNSPAAHYSFAAANQLGGYSQNASFASQLNGSVWSTTNHNQSGHMNASGANAAANATANDSFSSPYKNYNKQEVITDEHEMQKYIKAQASLKSVSLTPVDDTNTANSFRSYCNSAANLLKTSLYQMSPVSVSPTGNKTHSASAKDDLVAGIFGSGGSLVSGSAEGSLIGHHHHHHHHYHHGVETAGGTDSADADETLELQRLVASGQLTQCIYNLRGWLSTTIVQRLAAEIEKTNRALSGNTQADFRGFTDVQVGKVGLERLRKTAEVAQLVHAYVPMLPKIVEFVEVSSNQEYLVQRLRELASGCVLAEYRWNAGGTFNGRAWEEHLPTDVTILFHLFCTYLDGQLPPLPQPGGRPFYTRYVVHGDKRSADECRAAVRNKSGCAILVTNGQQRPKFNFMTARTIHSSVHDRNNLFNVIVEFLVYMRGHNEGMLESVNLGRSGINLMRVIGD